jgi:hypothetical protein
MNEQGKQKLMAVLEEALLYGDDDLRARAGERLEAGREAFERERKHGTIKPPTNATGARIGSALNDFARAQRGSVNEYLLPGEAIGNWISKASYGETPSAWDRVAAALDLGDVTPAGQVAGAASSVVPAIRRVSRRSRDWADVPLSQSRPQIREKFLETHGFRQLDPHEGPKPDTYRMNEDGSITAYSEYGGKGGSRISQKTFQPEAKLRALRKWMGY